MNRTQRTRGAGIGLLIPALLVLALAPAARAADLEAGEFDPAAWGALVARYAGPDGVDYSAWKKAGTAELDAYLDAAADFNLKSILGKEPRAAFLVNAYNAWAVRQILEHYPVAGVRDIKGFFDANARRIAGEDRTLDSIEAILAETMKHQPVVLFALAPGAKGMPRLVPEAYTSGNLIQNASKNAAEFLAAPAGLHYDPEANVLHLPPVFDRHAAVFESTESGLSGFLAQYLSLGDVLAVTQKDPQWVWTETDWSLDDAPAGAGE